MNLKELSVFALSQPSIPYIFAIKSIEETAKVEKYINKCPVSKEGVIPISFPPFPQNLNVEFYQRCEDEENIESYFIYLNCSEIEEFYTIEDLSDDKLRNRCVELSSFKTVNNKLKEEKMKK
ncbi:hypothetical protein O9G_001539 [Rozella allomycis CSF55]|uniref:Uncharacterized protein n=1 Tax=Rozella allomycis (strain CSF55) TaxID=988480 RepID=A0A075B1Z3_ROZAC|nr:hypothetical protein O9G_001539 [Rozella allomycis CSF55]|eukprot:EPZ36555.1 hypothetical protein O9G_001539 [Rozella allomycis CSF55]